MEAVDGGDGRVGPPPRTRTALTVAGSDSGGGAGVQADLKTFAAFRVFGASALTAVTAQNTLGVASALTLPPSLVVEQIAAVRDDIGIDATKIGMLGDRTVVRAVAGAVRAGGLGPVVLDPVMVSKHGHPLLAPEAVGALREELLPLVDVLTPNLPEAAVLLGCEARALQPPAARRDAARALLALGPRCVVLKGGHAPALGPEGDPVALDVWYDGARFGELSAPRAATRHTHGTGCTFSSAVAAGLARGWALSGALASAKEYVSRAIAGAPGLGRGHGPLRHQLADEEWRQIRGLAEGAREAPASPAPDAPRLPAPVPGPDARGRPRIRVLGGRAALPGPGPARRGVLREALAVYVITDRGLQRDRAEVDAVAAALAGGAAAVQLRAKGMDGRALRELGARLAALCADHGALFLVNDRLDVALACGAHGVHLGQDDLGCGEARRLAGRELLIGVSAATPAEAEAAQAAGADYLGVGSVFATSSKSDAGAPIGCEGLARVAGATDLPVVAIGGITPDNAAAAIAAGAVGVAAISAVVGASDVAAAAARLLGAVRGAAAPSGVPAR